MAFTEDIVTGTALEQKALDLFRECDISSKGYLTRGDLDHLNTELHFNAETLDQVFQSLSKPSQNGDYIISVDRFIAGFGTFFRHVGRQLSSPSSSPTQPRSSIADQSNELIVADENESGVSSGTDKTHTVNNIYEFDSTQWDPAFIELIKMMQEAGISDQ